MEYSTRKLLADCWATAVLSTSKVLFPASLIPVLISALEEEHKAHKGF